MKLPAMPVRSGRDATLNFEKLGVVVPTFVTELPTQAVEGQEVYFQNAVLAEQGVVWHLRYRAASSSVLKWEFVGGSDWFFFGGNIATASTSFVNLTGGPSFTVPRSGIYYLDVSAVMISAGAGGYLCVPFANGTELQAIAYFNLTTALEVVVRGRPSINLLNKGETITLKVRSTTGQTCTFVNCTLNIRPVRVI